MKAFEIKTPDRSPLQPHIEHGIRRAVVEAWAGVPALFDNPAAADPAADVIFALWLGLHDGGQRSPQIVEERHTAYAAAFDRWFLTNACDPVTAIALAVGSSPYGGYYTAPSRAHEIAAHIREAGGPSEWLGTGTAFEIGPTRELERMYVTLPV